MAIATRRRLLDELNIDAPVEFIYKFRYRAEYGDAGSENELCHVYLGRAQETVKPNDHEIAAVRFVSPAALNAELEAHPERFTPWFKMEWESLLSEHRDRLEKYGAV